MVLGMIHVTISWLLSSCSLIVMAGKLDYYHQRKEEPEASNVVRTGAEEHRTTRSPRNLIRRLYGPENANVRHAVSELEDGEYWRRGVLGDPNHFVSYENHPFEKSDRRRQRQQRRTVGGRKLQDENGGDEEGGEADEEPQSAFRPLRIRWETGALEQRRDRFNGPQIDFIENEILPRTAEFWSSRLSVVPVVGRLRISSFELANRRYCGDSEFTEVPLSHMSTGVDDTDLILYVSGTPSTRFCGPSTLAVAVACNFDQFDRPTAGAINFCLDQVELDDDGTASPAIVEDNVDVAVHEAAHVLGMSSNSYRFFWNSDTGTPRTERDFRSSTVTCVDGVQRTLTLPSENTMKFFVAENGQRYASIVTPKVATVARNQFDCQNLPGAQLENQPTGSQSCTGDHWDERQFYPEALSGVISPTTNIMSPVTFALLEDSGWYEANWTNSAVSPWGHAAGCDFVNNPCIIPDQDTGEPTLPDYGRGYFCNRPSKRGCSPAHSHKMACTVIDYSLYYPQRLPDPQFQYFQDNPNNGGPRQADYCPLYGSTYSGLSPGELDCRNEANADLINLYSEAYGANSMCFETTSGEGRCYLAQCILDEFVLKVNIRGEWLECKEDFEEIGIKVGSGAIFTTMTCPRLSSVCPDMFCPANCAGRGVCNFSAVVNGTKRPRCECFDPNDKSFGCSDTLKLDGKYLDDASGLINEVKESFFDPLVAVFVDHPDDWETESWAWAAGLLVIFLLMTLCICSSLWPRDYRKNRRQRKQRTTRRY